MTTGSTEAASSGTSEESARPARNGADIWNSDEAFKLLVQSVKDYAIFMLDPAGRIATWNAGAARIDGYTAAEIIGQHFSVFYTTAEVADGKPMRELETAAAEGSYEDEGWRLRQGGTQFWASVVINSVRAEDGRLAGFATVTRDLTERRVAQERALEDARRIAIEETARALADARSDESRSLAERLQRQGAELDHRRSEAETANRAKGEFLAAMSHELRTPLNAIGGYAQLMQMEIGGPLSTEQHEQLTRIERSQRHLLGIINDILNFSRIESGHLTYATEPVPIGELVDAVAQMILPQAREHALRFDTGTCAPTVVARADRAKVEQIVLNLLSNAVKFTEHGGSIGVRCDVEGDHVWVAVSDTGIGIAPDQTEQIFAPFVQVGRSLASPMQGTGLGLAISRDLARGMGGNLVVKTAQGQGSTFTLTLPRAE